MDSRDKILSAVAQNQPVYAELPGIFNPGNTAHDLVKEFSAIAAAIGSRVYKVNGFEEIAANIGREFAAKGRIFSNVDELSAIAETGTQFYELPHTFENIELAILKAQFAVAENGALWLTEDNMGQRVLPFICQHLALVVNRSDIVADMHAAYAKIGGGLYGYGAFIAGPSKTADIEQSLVLGAHGPRSLSVYVMDKEVKK